MMEWTEEVIERLRAFWSEGLSTAEIGRRLGVSKNAVVGKAHRLDLTARPSPIKRDAAVSARPRPPKRANGPTLPPLACEAAPVVSAPVAPAPTQVVMVTPVPVSRQAVKVAAMAPKSTGNLGGSVMKPYARVMACSWPIGEPGTRSFRFCDSESLPGKPYCDAHAQVAYVRVKDRRDDAA